jgi:predicted Zn-dependent protease
MRTSSRSRIAAFLASFAVTTWLSLPSPLLAQERPATHDQLPEMGTAAQSTLSIEDEYYIGRMVMRGLQDSGSILEDPEVGEYLQSLGLRLSSQAQDGSRRFNFFLVRDPQINAFALPGGFVGIHSGLFLETQSESELASVLAHEISHVTQRHIARGLESSARTNMVSTAAMLAAILIGSIAGVGGDVTMGAITATQGLAAQSQINFTRQNEYEADRIGIGLLASAGFDPNAMPAFFETMGRRTQLGPEAMPELLRTHPVTSARIAESRNRAAQYPAVDPGQGISYELMKERVRVLTTPDGKDPRSYYDSINASEADASVPEIYGQSIARIMAGDASKAIPSLRRLVEVYPERLQFHTALGQAQLASGDVDGALQTLERARKLSPRNVPVTVRYAEALMLAGRPKRAHEVLLDLFNTVPPNRDQIRQTAIAANAAGDVADAYSYMAEYYILGGDLLLAINQLELALSVPNISDVQRARFVARAEELRKALPKNRSIFQRRSPDEDDEPPQQQDTKSPREPQ